MDSTSHRPVPGQRWEFDASVAACFDDMLQRSIPDYVGMRGAVERLALPFVNPSADVVDLGASRGEGVAGLMDRKDARRWILVEKAPAMLEVLRARFDRPDVQVSDLDLRRGYPAAYASLTLAVLTLQFVPAEHRQRVLDDAFARTIPGGGMIVVEKVLGSTGRLQDAFVREYHDLKISNGYAREEVEAKAASLEGALVPLTAAENEARLRAAGFGQVECFWRWMNFAGWLAVRS